MNRKDLDALNELYLSVYDGEQLNEAPLTPEQIKYKNERAQLGVVSRGGKFVATGKVDPNLTSDWEWMTSSQAGKRQQLRAQKLAADLNRGQREVRISRAQDATIAAADKAEKAKAEKATRPVGSPLSRPAAGSPPPRPAAKPSGVVLARKNNVTGTLDKSTGKFTEKNWTDTETQRYQTRAAQNAPKSSPTTPAASAPKPAIGKLGNTSFERRTPTSAELRAAARERAIQKASGQDTSSVKNAEKALQAAQKTNLPTTGPSPAIPDLGSVGRNLAGANTVAKLNQQAPAGTALAKQQASNPNYKVSTAPTSAQVAGASQGIKPINNKKPITPVKQESYEWPSAKTIRDIAGAYASIYEAKKKVDQDQDGDNDFADVRVARMIASGMSKAEAIAAVKNKSYNEEVELWVNELLEEGYDLSEYTWEDMFEIYEATAMAKRGYDETEIRNKIAKSTGGGEAADRATALAARQTFRGGGSARDTLARRQRGDFRRTTSSDYGLRGYGHKSDDPAVKAKQAARGAQRGVLTPREKKQLNREAYEAYEFVASYLLENNFAETLNDANVIIENMSENWFEIIMEEKKPLPVAKMKRKESNLLDNE